MLEATQSVTPQFSVFFALLEFAQALASIKVSQRGFLQKRAQAVGSGKPHEKDTSTEMSAISSTTLILPHATSLNNSALRHDQTALTCMTSTPDLLVLSSKMHGLRLLVFIEAPSAADVTAAEQHQKSWRKRQQLQQKRLALQTKRLLMLSRSSHICPISSENLQ